MPLEWCLAPGVVLDLRHKAAGDFITVDDLQAALGHIGYRLQPLDIVLLWTGADQRPGRRPGTGLSESLGGQDLHPTRRTTKTHAFGPPSLKLISLKSGRTSTRVG